MGRIDDFKELDKDLRLHLLRVVQESAYGIYIIRDGDLIYANERFAILLGKSIEVIANMGAKKLFNSVVHPDFREYVEYFYITDPERIGRNSNTDFKILTKTSGELWIKLHTQVINGGNRPLLFGLIIDNSEYKQIEETLRISEERYRYIFNDSKDAIFITKSDSSFCDVNKAAERLTGYSKAELLRMRIPDLHYPDDLKAYDEFFDRIMAGEEVNTEAYLKRQDGSKVPVEFSNKRIMIRGTAFMHTVARDVTERIKINEALRASELFNRAVIENSPLGVSVRDKNGRLLSCNKAWRKIWNKSEADIKEDMRRERFELRFDENDEYLGEWQPEIRKIYERGGYIHIPETRNYYRRHGAEHWVSQYFYAINNNDGEVDKVVILTEDITERKKVEQSLKKSQDKFREITEMAPAGIFEMDTQLKLTFINRKAFEYIGYTHEDYERGISALDIIHPEDRAKAKENIMRIIGGQNMGMNEYRAVRKDGSEFDASVHSIPIFENDKVVGFRGIILDITERKRGEEALRISEMKNRLLIENAGQPIFSMSRDGVFLAMNSTAAAYFGGQPDDFIGKSMMELFPDEIAKFQLAKVQEAIDSGQKIMDENKTIIQHRIMWYIISIQPIMDPDGKITSAMLIANDITQRKMVEIREQSKSRLLDKLRGIKEIDECLRLGCQALVDGMFYKRSLLFLYDKNKKITHFGEIGFNNSRARQKALKSAPILRPGRRDNRHMVIGRSYFLSAVANGQEIKPVNRKSENKGFTDDIFLWQSGEKLYVPLMDEQDNPEGWLVADLPFDGIRPSVDNTATLEDLVDIIGKKVHEIQYLELLKNERLALKQKNITLREVLAHIEEEKMEIKSQVANEIESTLMPVMRKLIKSDGSVNKTCYNVLNHGLKSLSSSAGTRHAYSKLSPREIEICNLIKNGANSKKIASTLNISLATVQKHRESIRRKLGITNKSINLMTYLKG